MKTTIKTYTTEDLLKDMNELKESGTSPINEDWFFEEWEWTQDGKPYNTEENDK